MKSMLHNTTNQGSTMLHCAAKAGHAEVVQLAIDDYKLDPTACDKVSVCLAKQFPSVFKVDNYMWCVCCPVFLAVLLQ